jgi:hypothetical protein
MSNPPTNRFVGSGFTGAVFATILGAAIAPDHPQSPISVFVAAGVYILLVFIATATTTYLGFLVKGERRSFRARELALRTAATTVWLPPLLLFSEQKSVFVLIIWVALLIDLARLIAFVKSTMYEDGGASSRKVPEVCAFSVLKQDFPSGISILGALMIQGAIFGAIGGHDVLAGVLYVAGTTAIAHRTLKMFQDAPAPDGRTLKERLPSTLLTAIFLIVFAWLPQIVGPGGAGAGGNSTGGTTNVGRSTEAQPSNAAGARKDKRSQRGTANALAWLRDLFKPAGPDSRTSSFAAARRIFDSTFPQSHRTSRSLMSLRKTKIATAVIVAGPVFAGVELYPEVRPHARLVAPPLMGTRGSGVDRSDPLSIPFDGVYWFWRGPSDQPPLNSVVMHGSPSAQFFRSTDGDGMSMEARQNLGFAVDPKRYGAIEIFIANADPFPNTVSILLKLRNTAAPDKPALSLGMKDVIAPASSIGIGTATPQMMTFRIPSAIPIGSFDELTVSYYLKGARSNRSARIAIDRFRLVPRGE